MKICLANCEQASDIMTERQVFRGVFGVVVVDSSPTLRMVTYPDLGFFTSSARPR